MTDSLPPDPGNTPSTGDPGDDTASRYRYQWTWAAVMCCTPLDRTTGIEEVFCEQHEDVLLKHSDGRFTGQQVKTRASDQEVWKSSDEAFISSCARFVKLDTAFSGHFRGFQFLTNHPLHAASTATSPAHVLEQIAGAATVSDLPRPVASWLRKVGRQAGCSEADTLAALKKATVSDDLPKLRDASMRLIDAITNCWPTAADCSHDAVRRAAVALIEECGRASSLDHQQLLPAYLLVIADPGNADIAARIRGKQMTLQRVQEVLQRGLSSTATLEGDPGSVRGPGEGSTDLLTKKLDAGGFSAVSVNSAEDLRSKAEYLGITWTKKHGQRKGLQRYDHVRSLVLSDAARSFEDTQTAERRFGPEMRENLRRRFRQRREDGSEVFDCADEHLEGVAYVLTAQCKVQWSTDRPWEDS